jgi:hypothetical protein
MNFTPEEIKEGDALIASFETYVGDAKFGRCIGCQRTGMYHCAHADTCGNNTEHFVKVQCAIIAQKQKVDGFERVVFIFKLHSDHSCNSSGYRDGLLPALENAKRILLYLESLK